MASITISDVPEEVQEALRARAALHGRSTEAEIRMILEEAAKSEGRLKIGSLLASMTRETGGLTTAEAEHLHSLRDQVAAEPISFR